MNIYIWDVHHEQKGGCILKETFLAMLLGLVWPIHLHVPCLRYILTAVELSLDPSLDL